MLLAQARYRRRFAKTFGDLKVVADELQQVLKKSPKEPEAYLELAAVALARRNAQEARQVLETGLKALPDDPSLHERLAIVELQAGSRDAAIARLRQSLQVLPDEVKLRWLLANVLAERGDNVELRVQIDELRRLNYVPVLVDFLEAHLQANSNNWQKSRQALLKLQKPLDSAPDLKARLNTLLAKCYSHLGDSERQKDAYQRGVDANPQSMPARLGLAMTMVLRGESEQAIEEYRKLADQSPAAWSPLVGLLLARNQLRPPDQRDWTEVDNLIKRVKAFAPTSSEWVILQVALLSAQNKTAEAETLLAEARVRSPKDLGLWVKSAEILRRQRKYAEAGTLLDQAGKLGDTVDLRLERAQWLIAQGGAELPRALGALAANADAFPPDQHRRLLETLASEITRLNDPALAE